MNVASFLNRMIGSNYFNVLRRWHRFYVEGTERLLSVGPAMIFTNHGRATPSHLYMLKALLAFEYGEPAYMIAPNIWFKMPYLRDAVAIAGFVPAELEHARRIAKRGLKLIVSPGRHRESWGASRDKYRICWTGEGSDPQTTEDGIKYVRWAIECKVPIIPVAATGVDDSYVGLWDSFNAWSHHLKPFLEEKLPLYSDLLDFPGRLAMPPIPWVGLGPGGPWPFSPPWPVRITHHVGAPIRMADMRMILNLGPEEEIEADAQCEAILAEVQRCIQELLDANMPRPPERRVGAATNGPNLRLTGLFGR